MKWRGDGVLTQRMLASAAIAAEICTDLSALCRGIEEGAGAIFVAEEALVHPATTELLQVLGAQPAWSDLPVLVSSVERARRSPGLTALGAHLNVTLLDRPIAMRTMVNAVKGALRARMRQYEARALITQLAQARELQRDMNEQLRVAGIRAEKRSDEAVAAQERAEDSERQLRSVAEFRELFIGILGHDLRNPLSAITMAASMMLKRARLDENDERNVTRIRSSSQRMGGMITQLLDLTRARLGGGLVLDVKPADLREICQGVVDEFETGSTQLDMEGEVSGTWDRDRLAQVLSNVVGNAVEYAAAGTAVVVRTYAEAETVVVEISNQGAPIPEEVLPFIFEPFRRANGREISKTGNLGLGLYIAHQIVLEHGGTLDARSFGGRTTFTIRLPRHLPPA